MSVTCMVCLWLFFVNTTRGRIMPWHAIAKGQTEPVIDKHYTLPCPHCGTKSNLSAVSIPEIRQAVRYKVEQIIIGYRCDSCNAPVALRFQVTGLSDNQLNLSEEYEELERPMETFDYQHLPNDVASDFKEALTCYSHGCCNAAAAMCRRTIQSVATNLGATGTSKVEKQILDAKDTADMDDDTFAGLKEVMLGGHDGAHPHLPEVTTERAAVLVEMMKDVLTQIYVRKERIQTAMKLRQQAIAEKKAEKKDA